MPASKIEVLLEELKHISALIDSPLQKGDIPSLLIELDAVSCWLARSAEIVADAVQINMDDRKVAMENLVEGTSATKARDIVNGMCSQTERLRVLAERMNAALTHRIDAIRSIISAEKALAQVGAYSGGHA